MIGFFDTSVHVAVLRGALPIEAALDAAGNNPIRLSPVVASELLRVARGRAARSVETLIDALIPLEPPSWRGCWYDAGRLLPRLFSHHEAIGLARLQNDLLIALTARYTGAILVSLDRHFTEIRRHVPFTLRMLSA